MLGDVSQAIKSLDQMFGAVGALGSFLSFLLAIYLEWGNIKGRLKRRGQPASQAFIETVPAMRVPPVGYPASKSPKLDVANLIGNLILDLTKTMFAIFIAIVVGAEYLLFADYYLGTGLPFEWLLIASLILGAIVGAYLRARSWIFLLLIGVLSQVGILVLTGWGLEGVPAILESFLASGLVAGLF